MTGLSLVIILITIISLIVKLITEMICMLNKFLAPLLTLIMATGWKWPESTRNSISGVSRLLIGTYKKCLLKTPFYLERGESNK